MKKTIKILMVTMLMFVMYGMFSSVKAASAGISASKKDVKVGEKVTINVKVNAAAWDIHISGAVSEAYSDVSSDGNNTSFTKSLSFTPSSAGTYTIKMTGTISDGATNATSKASGEVTIKATEAASSRDNSKTDTTKTDTTKTEEPTFKAANDTMYATGNINVRKSYSADSDKLGTLQFGEKIIRTGVGSNGWSKVNYNGGVGYIKTSLLTNEEPKKSDDKALKSLTIEGFEIDPQFDPEITDYTIALDKEVEALDIKAEPNDEKAKVVISGNEKIGEGDGIVKITVTAEDGTTRIYSIVASKSAADKTVKLTALRVAGYTISPAFSPNVTEYKITINDANVNKLDVTATVADATKTKVEITGNTDIKQGNNEILIKLKDEEGTEVGSYKIIATKNVSATSNTKSKDKKWMLYAGIGVIAILVLAIVIVIRKSRSNMYYDDEEEYEDGEESNTNKEAEEEQDDNASDTVSSPIKDLAEDKLGEDEEDLPKESDSESINKDVDYYSNKISELFDSAKDNKSSDDAGLLQEDEKEAKESDTIFGDNNDDDEFKPRRSKGKHSK